MTLLWLSTVQEKCVLAQSDTSIVLYIFTLMLTTAIQHTIYYPEMWVTFLIWWLDGQDQNRQFVSPNSHRPTMLCPCCAPVNMKLQPDIAQIAKLNDRQYFRIHGIYSIYVYTQPVYI